MKKQFLSISAAWALVAILVLPGCSAIRKMQGDYHYDHFSWSGAIPYYEKSINKKDNPDVIIRLADCYFRMNDMQRAAMWYARVMGLPEALPEHRLRYAQTLIQGGNYAEAAKWLNRYIEARPNDAVAKNYLAACDSVAVYKRDTMLWDISKLDTVINSGGSNFSPVYYGNGIVFASERKHSRLAGDAEWTGRNFLDLFYTEADSSGSWENPVRLEGKINSLYHEGPMCFTKDLKIVYFTRNDYIRGKRGRSSDYVNNLKIYSASLVEGEWQNITELPINSKEFSTGHPALTPDEQTLYFVSDRPGGFGGTDLWVSHRIGENMWSEPENAGALLNTPGNEMFPFVSADHKLYFSSTGHKGIGGLDIFVAQWVEPGSSAAGMSEGGRNDAGWAVPVNLHCPVNSSRDDFGFIIDPQTGTGFFSSNRNKPEGLDEVFAFNGVEQIFRLEGIVVNRVTQQPMGNSKVVMRPWRNAEPVTVYTRSDGSFEFEIENENKYNLRATHDLCFPKTDSVLTFGEKYSKTWFVKLELDTVPFNKPVVLKNIYYDFDKWDIRADAQPELDKLYDFMVANGTVKIELSSHTDSRGSNRYNERLSQKRAESVVKYLLNKGIEEGRLVAKGYGENVLVNGCKDGADCTEEAHQENRRTEFKVIGK